MTSASATWEAQPPVEKNRASKLCSSCSQPASLVCTKCRCTLYCGQECQRKHWKLCHKAQCSPDPLFFLSQPLSLPRYRDFTDEEHEKHLSFTLQTGRCHDSPTDHRDGHCKLITITDPGLEEHLQKKTGQPDGQILTRMGWNLVSIENVTGFSHEDEDVYQILFDDNFQNRPDLPENHIGNALINTVNPPRGQFVVIKVPSLPTATFSDRVPFSKSELVDMMTWRLFCGRHNLVSSRMFRENMRRRELCSYMSQMGSPNSQPRPKLNIREQF